MNKYMKQALITIGVMFALNYMPASVSSIFRSGTSNSDTGGIGTGGGGVTI
jgi:hypothetical protein